MSNFLRSDWHSMCSWGSQVENQIKKQKNPTHNFPTQNKNKNLNYMIIEVFVFITT